jgi:hypothetical protein
MLVAEGVDPARVDPAIELGSLLGQEAAVALVVPGAREVELSVCRIEVAHHEHAQTAAAQALHSFEEGFVEAELVGDAAVVAVLAAALWKVAVGDHQPAETRDLDASLAVESFVVQRGLHPVGTAPREQADTRVAALLGR